MNEPTEHDKQIATQAAEKWVAHLPKTLNFTVRKADFAKGYLAAITDAKQQNNDTPRLTMFIEREWSIKCDELGIDYEWTVYNSSGQVIGRSRKSGRAAIDAARGVQPAAKERENWIPRSAVGQEKLGYGPSWQQDVPPAPKEPCPKCGAHSMQCTCPPAAQQESAPAAAEQRPCPECKGTTLHHSRCKSRLTHPLGNETLTPRADVASQETGDLPSVGGRVIDGTLAMFARRAQILLRDEQAKPSPDNALIAFLCDAVRLTREYDDAVKRSLSPDTPSSFHGSSVAAQPVHRGPYTKENCPICAPSPAQEKPKQIECEGLDADTFNLVVSFAQAMADKLKAAQDKYGYEDGWARGDWREECQRHLLEHLSKGDPRDVANYCAFLWSHGWPTVAAQEKPEPRAMGIRRLWRRFRGVQLGLRGVPRCS